MCPKANDDDDDGEEIKTSIAVNIRINSTAEGDLPPMGYIDSLWKTENDSQTWRMISEPEYFEIGTVTYYFYKTSKFPFIKTKELWLLLIQTNYEQGGFLTVSRVFIADSNPKDPKNVTKVYFCSSNKGNDEPTFLFNGSVGRFKTCERDW